MTIKILLKNLRSEKGKEKETGEKKRRIEKKRKEWRKKEKKFFITCFLSCVFTLVFLRLRKGVWNTSFFQ